tara:strand:- start:282 stop:488 length:207 start_codon:yes stop_codon:yes gene_type:complete
MRQDILNAIKTFDNDTLLDVALTMGFINVKQLLEARKNNELPKKATKEYIRKMALADENVAECVLFNA